MTQKRIRNEQGCGTVRQRSDGRWEARYTLGKDPGTGKQIQKSIYAKTQKEAQIKLRNIYESIENNSYCKPLKITVADWLDIWVKNYINNVKPFTFNAYFGLVQNHIKPSIGAVLLCNLDTTIIQNFYNTLWNGSKNSKRLSPKTIKNVHCVIHRALEQAIKLNYIRVNPSDACILPRIEKHNITPLDENDICNLINEIKGHKYEVLYTVDLFTGMRQGEILGLTWDCIDFENGTITINKQLQKEKKVGGQYIFASLKNNKIRIISPAPSIMNLLFLYRTNQKDILKSNGLVFTNEYGEHLAHTTVYKNFKKIVAELGIPATRFHDLRHSYAVAALQAGDDVKTVQENLGHHSAAFTLDVYGHVTDSMKKRSALHMETYINSIVKLQRVE